MCSPANTIGHSVLLISFFKRLKVPSIVAKPYPSSLICLWKSCLITKSCIDEKSSSSSFWRSMYLIVYLLKKSCNVIFSINVISSSKWCVLFKNKIKLFKELRLLGRLGHSCYIFLSLYILISFFYLLISQIRFKCLQN